MLISHREVTNEGLVLLYFYLLLRIVLSILKIQNIIVYFITHNRSNYETVAAK